jgi:hypothetical protein
LKPLKEEGEDEMKAALNTLRMSQMRTLAVALLMSLAVNPLTYGYTFSDYTWIEYNGHLYARTLDYSDWTTAQMWAQEVSGHLVVIDDAAENAWLAETFKGLGLRTQSANSINSLVWIGLQCIGPDVTNLADWQWVTGQPLTYSAPWYGGIPQTPPVDGHHAYLHTNTHWQAQTWWNSGPIDWVYEYNLYGVIEIDSLNPSICVNINIDPDTLNLNSKGKWVTCYIELPQEYDVADIDVDSVLLEGLLEVQRSDIRDGVLMVKFDREDLAAYLDAVLGVVPPAEAELVVMGNLTDGTPFEGRDTIRVIDEGGGK